MNMIKLNKIVPLSGLPAEEAFETFNINADSIASIKSINENKTEIKLNNGDTLLVKETLAEIEFLSKSKK